MSHLSTFDIKLAMLIRWGNLRIISSDGNKHIVKTKSGKQTVLLELSDSEIYNLTDSLKWLDDLPPVSLRPDKICGRIAREKNLESLTLEQFIVLDNTLQGYITTFDDKLLIQIGKILYCKKSLPALFQRFRPRPWQMTAILLWISGFKKLLSHRYPNFFKQAKPSKNRLDADIIRKNVETMLRALTKGDITKDRQIRDAPIFAACAELEAIAIESEQLKAKQKK